MVSGMEEETFDSKIDPCGVCGTRVMSNSVLCTACGKWVHARCTEKKKVSVYVNKNFVCKKCRSVVNNFKRSADEKLCDGVETVSKFTYLGDRLNATGGCEAVVTARSRIGWMKFRECSKILKGGRFSLKMKGKLYKSCVRSAMLYGSEAWCLREKEMAVLLSLVFFAIAGVSSMPNESLVDSVTILVKFSVFLPERIVAFMVNKILILMNTDMESNGLNRIFVNMEICGKRFGRPLYCLKKFSFLH